MKIAILWNSLIAVVLAAISGSAVFAAGQNAPPGTARIEDGSKLEGTWRGDSICVANRAVCSDERVVYRVAKVSGRPGYVSIAADRIVNGEAITMGTLEFQHDRSMRTLVCTSSEGVWLLKVGGNKMEGTLTLPDKAVLRRVTLKKEE